jgi:DNA-binding MarR family transcriptional regulator
MTDAEVPWLDAGELECWVSLIKLSARIVALSDGELRRRHGITGRDYELLHHLSSSAAGMRISDLARMIEDTSSCITHRVNRLCQAGLVRKRTDATDQRARTVLLTAQGRRLLERAAPDHVRRVRRWVIDPLDQPDLRHLTRIASALNAHLRVTEPLTD